MKNLFVFLFECCVQAVSAQNATWRFGASGANFVPLCATCATYANVPSGTNFIYERRVPILIIYHNVH
nr:hypothetical protein [Prevotella sp.]